MARTAISTTRKNANTPIRGFTLDGAATSILAPESYIIPSTFSLCFWYKPRNAVLNDRVFDQQDGGPEDGFTIIHGATNSPQVSFRVNNGASQTVNITTTDMVRGEWNFITATFTANSAKLFLNTVQQGATDTSCAISAPAARFTVGKRAGSSANFARGSIRDISVFSKVLSTTEISDLYTGMKTPVDIGTCDIWWDTKELTGTTATDYSGNARHGTYSSANFFSEAMGNVFLPITKALDFTGVVASRVVIDDNVALRPETTNIFTWCAWIYINKINANVLPRIIEKGSHYICYMGDQTNGKANNIALEVTNESNSTATEYWGSTKLQPMKWYHVAVSFNDGTTKIYVNGHKDAVAVIGGPYVSPLEDSSASSLRIGNSSGNDRNFPGLISKVFMYNTILTQEQIRTIMLGGTVSGAVASYKFLEGTGATVADDSDNAFNGTITSATWISLTTSRTQAGTRTAA